MALALRWSAGSTERVNGRQAASIFLLSEVAVLKAGSRGGGSAAALSPEPPTPSSQPGWHWTAPSHRAPHCSHAGTGGHGQSGGSSTHQPQVPRGGGRGGGIVAFHTRCSKGKLSPGPWASRVAGWLVQDIPSPNHPPPWAGASPAGGKVHAVLGGCGCAPGQALWYAGCDTGGETPLSSWHLVPSHALPGESSGRGGLGSLLGRWGQGAGKDRPGKAQ